MKKLITLLFAISVIALFSCNSEGAKKEEIKTDSTIVNIDTVVTVPIITDVVKK
jgi:ABC-type Zn uptake system ZnuABC Zn-binding protein ZnuA